MPRRGATALLRYIKGCRAALASLSELYWLVIEGKQS